MNKQAVAAFQLRNIDNVSAITGNFDLSVSNCAIFQMETRLSIPQLSWFAV